MAARIQEVDYATVLGMVHVCNVFCGWEVRNAVYPGPLARAPGLVSNHVHDRNIGV